MHHRERASSAERGCKCERCERKRAQHREYMRGFHKTPAGRAANRRTSQNWNRSEKGKAFKDQHRAENIDIYREHGRKNAREWRARNPERARQLVREYEKRNPEKVKEWKRNQYRRLRSDPERYAEHRRKANERKKAYRQTPEGKAYFKHENALRRKRVRSAPGRASVAQLHARWEFYGGRCHYCGGEADSWDHVIPIVRGGSNWPANLRPACLSCNARKENLDAQSESQGRG